MGVIIEHNNISFWEPSQFVGRFFFKSIQAIGELINKQAGIDEYTDDTFTINGQKFNDFVVSFYNHFKKSNNLIEKKMMEEVLNICLAILVHIKALVTKDSLFLNFNVHEIEKIRSYFR